MAIGFIILRHVNNADTNKYWQICYNRIRKYYPESDIVIIDDNSNYKYIDTTFQDGLYKTVVFRSLWAGRGELLPYWYYVAYGWFEAAVILHDSVFINSDIDFSHILDKKKTPGYQFLWEFEIKQDNDYKIHHDDEIKAMQNFNTSEVDTMLEFHRCKEAWVGCFGAMSIVTLEYLKKVNHLFPLANLLDCIIGRFNRMSFERVIACLFQYTDRLYDNGNHTLDRAELSLFGNIFQYCKFGMGFQEAMAHTKLPLIKVWTGR